MWGHESETIIEAYKRMFVKCSDNLSLQLTEWKLKTTGFVQMLGKIVNRLKRLTIPFYCHMVLRSIRYS